MHGVCWRSESCSSALGLTAVGNWTPGPFDTIAAGEVPIPDARALGAPVLQAGLASTAIGFLASMRSCSIGNDFCPDCHLNEQTAGWRSEA